MQREMVKAMQDPGAGVKLVEFGPKRGRAATKYFTGKDAIEWLISWSFANDRTSGATLATEMLRNGFFHTVNLDPITNSLALSKDGILSRDVMDSEEAKYVFVSMTSTNPNAVFQSDDDSSSDSEDDILATSSRPESLAAETGFDSDGKVLKQGFLLKKSKKHRGAIPLCGLTIYELDNEIREPETDQQLVSEGGSKRQSARNSRNKVNRILLITATGERVVVEATSAEERSAWIGELRVAVASLDITSS
ncbi:Pleckstrin [Geodia barretti]|uniref:Pleckstrin n=1 Tax=Geodia barretti TaxID=519541 RepID=A0AA35WH69_GEOBA|nr:Pleckstrin [Geodia barretti]